MLLRHAPLVPLLAAGALVAVAQAALTGTTEPPGPVAGFAVDGLHYALDPGDPTSARTVTFRLRGGTPVRVEARVAGRTVPCRADGTRVACDLAPGVPVRALETIRVVAAR